MNTLVEILKGGILQARGVVEDLQRDKELLKKSEDALKVAAEAVRVGAAHPSAIFDIYEDILGNDHAMVYEEAVRRKVASDSSYTVIEDHVSSDGGYDLNQYLADNLG